MAGWHHWLNGLESEWTPGVGDGQGGLACWDSWGRKESDTTERLIWSDLIWSVQKHDVVFQTFWKEVFAWLHVLLKSVFIYFFIFHYFAPHCNNSSWKSHLSFLTQILLLQTPLTLSPLAFPWFLFLYFLLLWNIILISIMLIVFFFISLRKYNFHNVCNIFYLLFTDSQQEFIWLAIR